MDKYFTTEQGLKVNMVEHTLEQIEKWPNLTIRIGTDSQNYGAVSRFVTTIVYRYGKRGAHYIYYKEDIPRMKIEYNRLYDEGVRTIAAHDMLTGEIPVSVEALEFDFNDYKKTLSNQLVSTFKSWGYGNAVFKSGQMLACKAADHICRR